MKAIAKINFQEKNLIRPAVVAIVFLLIAFLVNKIINGWNWDYFDFIIAGILIFITGLVIEVLNKLIKNKIFKYITVLIILAGFLWIWAELAVGVFTNWGS